MNLFNGGYTGANMVANVSNAVQTTLASIAPILEVAIGIVFAFVIIKYLIGIFKEAGKASGLAPNTESIDSVEYDISTLHESEDGTHLVGEPMTYERENAPRLTEVKEGVWIRQ